MGPGWDQEGVRYFRFRPLVGDPGNDPGATEPDPGCGSDARGVRAARRPDPGRNAGAALSIGTGAGSSRSLDPEEIPLALLATALPQTDFNEAATGDWTAGGRGEERPFVSPTLTAQGLPQRDASGRHFHVETLERRVAQRAGPRRRAQWFRVHGDEALGLDDHADPQLNGRRLSRADFPLLTLSARWPEESAGRLVEEYLAWLAPYLLTLPGLPDLVRRDLEAKAVHHALLVDALWRLYPRVLDPELIQRARVEARLRRSSA